MAKKAPKEKAPDQPTFEEALARLEGIVYLLEDGDIGLNESLTRYEEGVRILRQAYELLQHVERRIELLSGVDADGNPIVRPFATDNAELPDQPPRPPLRSGLPPRDIEGSQEGRKDRQPGNNGVDSPGGLL
ncbi:MAG: exodeoxyribonuclease VII small subunit [Pirellulales bacterium]|nr:exodeoxyribonuclease VII small subunit [Pirellulales bacterium]